MSAPRFELLRLLLRRQTLAALGTLHRGEPYVSMVPFALDEATPEFLIHVSSLSPHTRDMLEHRRVSLLVVAPDDGGAPQARARATIQGDAAPLDAGSPRHASARALYLRRFPQAAEIFALPDFSLFAIRPDSVRFIGGFAQAVGLTPELFARALGEG
ncbi:MAG: pyridoxamine 5'-phosphate oxidase family protein [Burkholderiales bacterium]|nr:MAG: pyridoxamine 5'-phosphate oxidase family protein [Burkholderiales bacterium]